jgi:Zn-dependent metalloprotease
MPEDIFPIALSSASCPGSPSPAKFCTDAIDEKTAEIARLTWRNAELTDKFFHDKFARNSFDGSGATVRSLIRFRAGWANAGWIDELGMIVYGDGNPFVHHPFAKALDISAHELTHGLTARTSALDYVSEPGALNESYSDVFAKLISREFEGGDDWTLGKAIFLTEGRFLRDMRNPNISHVRDQIHRNETCSFRNDGCGVHANSGIPNLAAVLLADQIGVEDFGKLYFSVLTRYLRPNSDFKDALAQTLAACELIWGENNSRCTAVTSSFQAVGIE